MEVRLPLDPGSRGKQGTGSVYRGLYTGGTSSRLPPPTADQCHYLTEIFPLDSEVLPIVRGTIPEIPSDGGSVGGIRRITTIKTGTPTLRDCVYFGMMALSEPRHHTSTGVTDNRH